MRPFIGATKGVRVAHVQEPPSINGPAKRRQILALRFLVLVRHAFAILSSFEGVSRVPGTARTVHVCAVGGGNHLVAFDALLRAILC